MSTGGPDHREWWLENFAPAPPGARSTVQKIIHQSGSGAAAFLADLDDGSRVWVKALGNPQGDQVLPTEYICSQVGRHLGASVAESLIVELPAQYHRQSFHDPHLHRMVSGPAYATKHLGLHLESDSLLRGGAPDAVLAGLCALWDLFIGGDEQWLYTPFRPNGLVSFDHSLWLTRGEGDWDADVLADLVDLPSPLQDLHRSLSAEAVGAVQASLRSLTPSTTLAILNTVPVEWYEQPRDLATMGWFIHCRLEAVAERLERLRDD